MKKKLIISFIILIILVTAIITQFIKVNNNTVYASVISSNMNNTQTYSTDTTINSLINLNSIAGSGWDYINHIENTTDGGIIAVGEFSEYTISAITGAENGVDLNRRWNN